MADIGLPKIDIIFKGLGVSAVQRGSKGVAVLIIKDDTDKTFIFAEYRSIADFESAEQAKYTAENVEYIKDVLEGAPLKLIVARMDTEGTLTDTLKAVKGKVPMNCWIAMADATQGEKDDLVSFIKASNQNDKKRYKVFLNQATISDDIHVVNFTNPEITFKDARGKKTADKAVPWLMGYLAGLSLDMSAIARPLQKFESVTEPEDLEAAVNAGEFVLFNDEGDVRVVRGINSLVTTGQGVTDDMKFILIVEVMDLIYTDIFTTWKKFYKGKYKNYLDNQMLLIGAINSYFAALAIDLLLDPNFENEAVVDVEAQRLANIPKYGKETVDTWDDEKIMQMTVGTDVFLNANIKILNAMEDFRFNIFM
ncbi:phage tail sheath C-terminal domain-containing protein [Clostridium formicaceticum]|uniref:Phage tail sheath protein n=1 Tax=Clostridium formicaceticum TaxID=1497 RepID=A0AAC9RK60_9CLOT|nr:phage tail sheath C-terminal domain-containing protein [Clostridium formicaceticum]AOY76683.1 phage tail sheath protein [Clostridium formicaceticum]ARE87114.1 Phage tail sheath protein [Clostridium formicaceticum]